VQVSEEVAPIEELYLPFAQEVQRSAPNKEKAPGRQVAQSAAASWAEAALAASERYVPATHSVHVLAAVAPVAALYFPAPQITQSAAESWAEAALAASERYVPATHSVHVLAAVAALYFPAPQMIQSEMAS
jgi:hypothetical protein